MEIEPDTVEERLLQCALSEPNISFGPYKLSAHDREVVLKMLREYNALQLEKSRLSIQVIKAKEIVQALVACLNLNDQLMTELLRLSKDTRQPVDQTLIRSKLSFDDRMKKLLGQPKSVLEM